MNIFNTIESVTTRIERFHSQFLADALKASRRDDRSLFESVWRLMAPDNWPVPARVRIETEESVQGGRIDICIYAEESRNRVLAIEVKTVDDSTEPDQLCRYFAGLREHFLPQDIQLVYLTPFNADHAGDKASSLPTVKEFEGFKAAHPEAKDARHVSWLDVAEIRWDKNALWEQHSEYVRGHISSKSRLGVGAERNRPLSAFFGGHQAQRFENELRKLPHSIEGNRLIIDLAEQTDSKLAVRTITDAIRMLLQGNNIEHRECDDDFSSERRRAFLDSKFGDTHRALFELSSSFPGLWVQGKGDYGLRIAHQNHRGGVSALRSNGPGRLVVHLKR